MTLGDNIRAARLHANLSQKAIAEWFGIKRSAVSQWEAGKTTPGLARARFLAERLGYSVDYFVSDNFTPTQSDGVIRPTLKSKVRISIYDIEASGGDGCLNNVEVIQDFLVVEKQYLHDLGVPSDNLKIITIRGDSMEPELNSGDLVLIHHVPVPVNKLHDGMFVVLIDDMLFIKRLQRLPGKKIKVISTNKGAYEPFNVDAESLMVIGRVVFAWRGKKF